MAATTESAAPTPDRVAAGPVAVSTGDELGWPLPVVDLDPRSERRRLWLRARREDLVVSIAAGVVTSVGRDDELGRTVTIEHGPKLSARYGGLGEVLVHEGLQVVQGTAVGVPEHGTRTEPIVLEVTVDGERVDPLLLIGAPPHHPRLPPMKPPPVPSPDPATVP